MTSSRCNAQGINWQRVSWPKHGSSKFHGGTEKLKVPLLLKQRLERDTQAKQSSARAEQLAPSLLIATKHLAVVTWNKGKKEHSGKQCSKGCVVHHRDSRLTFAVRQLLPWWLACLRLLVSSAGRHQAKVYSKSIALRFGYDVKSPLSFTTSS